MNKYTKLKQMTPIMEIKLHFLATITTLPISQK